MLSKDELYINDQIINASLALDWNVFREHCINNLETRFSDVFYTRIKDLIISGKFRKPIPKESIFFRARDIDPQNVVIDNNELAHGYNTIKDAGAPPADKCSDGRANASNERFLYLAKEEYTAIAEINPIILQLVNISKFTLESDISVLILPARTREFDSLEATEDENKLIRMLIWEFAKPIKDKNDYLPTQCIANLVRNSRVANGTKYDGISYASMHGYGGQNLVLFDPDKAKLVKNEEKIVRINNIALDVVNINDLNDNITPKLSPRSYTQDDIHKLKVKIATSN